MELTETEKKVLSEMLDDFADRLGNAGCNDFRMPDDLAFRQAVADYQNVDDPDAHAKPSAIGYDFIVLAYLRSKLGI